MRIFQHIDFGEVQGYELGYSPIGKPLLTVFIYFIDSILIDTGLRHMRKTVLRLAQEKKIDSALLTHHHEDHSGNAAAISNLLGIPIIGNPLTAKKTERNFKIFPYQHIMWGKSEPVEVQPYLQSIETEKNVLKPILTPGHSKDHTCYFSGEKGWLFSGDLYLADKIKFFRADECLSEQIRSLKKVMELEFDTLFCAHRPHKKNGKARIAAKLQFLEDIYGSVVIYHQKGFSPKSIMKELKIKESILIKAFCFGNVSAENIIISAIKSFP